MRRSTTRARSGRGTARKHSSLRERGAAAVELALVAPILVALAAGIVDFGFRYQQHIEYTNAAMQSARSMSISNDATSAVSEARTFVGNPAATVTVSAGGCNAGNSTVRVSIEGTRATLTGMFGQNFTVRAAGRVRCQ